MKLTNLNIQSVPSGKVSSNKTIKVAIIGHPQETTTDRVISRSSLNNPLLITAIAREHDHTKFHTVINTKIYEVICPGYIPEIIFSSLINDYWEYPKPDTCLTRESIDDLDINWDYLYDGMEIKGTIKDDTFVINIFSLKKSCQKHLDKYKYKQLKEAKYKKKNK